MMQNVYAQQKVARLAYGSLILVIFAFAPISKADGSAIYRAREKIERPGGQGKGFT
jgi:hypothetical protein